MSILQEVQKSLKAIGFSPKLEPFNHRISSIFVISFSGVISQWIFLIYEADSGQEYMESIYVATACTGVLLSFSNTILSTKKIFLFINSIDEFINESK